MTTRQLTKLTVNEVLTILPKVTDIYISVKMFPESIVRFRITKKELKKVLVISNPDDQTHIFYVHSNNRHFLIM